MLNLFEPPVNKGFSDKKGVSDLTLPKEIGRNAYERMGKKKYENEQMLLSVF